MKIGTKLTIELKVKKDGIRANVTSEGEEKTYFFPFDTNRNEASRISQLIGLLPRNFYVDAFLGKTKWK